MFVVWQKGGVWVRFTGKNLILGKLRCLLAPCTNCPKGSRNTKSSLNCLAIMAQFNTRNFHGFPGFQCCLKSPKLWCTSKSPTKWHQPPLYIFSSFYCDHSRRIQKRGMESQFWEPKLHLTQFYLGLPCPVSVRSVQPFCQIHISNWPTDHAARLHK